MNKLDGKKLYKNRKQIVVQQTLPINAMYCFLSFSLFNENTVILPRNY